MRKLEVLLCLVASIAHAGELKPQFDEYMDGLAKARGFMGTVLVAKAGKVLYASARGMANVEHEVPNTLDTKFRIGSISKQFTAAAVLLLEEHGKLATTDLACKYIDSCPTAWSKITVHHLLTHTSGIPDFTTFPDYRKTWMRLPFRPQELLLKFQDKPLEFEPGSTMRYSNSGYTVLAAIMEKASGKKYEDLMDELIFHPLGMKNTGSNSWTPILPHRASAYRFDGDILVNAEYDDFTLSIGGGSLYSTVNDLLLWDQALYGNNLLSKASLEKMFTPEKNGYAYGWNIRERFKRRVMEHDGTINGFVSLISRYPEDQTLVVILCNVDDPPSSLPSDLPAIAFGEPYEVFKERTIVKVDPQIYDAYLGKYEPERSFVLTVTREGGRLFVQGTNQARREVFPESPTKFFVKRTDTQQISFVKGPDGKVTHAVLHMGTVEKKAPKIE
jgi:CubicO group peptidase (beta-lactamase class C family)